MSKSNRIKGAFSKEFGCRMSTPERCESLERRKEGLTVRHQPTPSVKPFPKMTKTIRKTLGNISPAAMKHMALNQPFEMARN